MDAINTRPLGKVMRGLAGFLSIVCALSAGLLIWLAFGDSFGQWGWWITLQSYMAYVFGFAALRARAPYPFHRQGSP